MLRDVTPEAGAAPSSSARSGCDAQLTICLPKERVPAARTAVAKTKEPLRRRCRVLIIDDHTDSADSLGLLLRQYGYDVAVAYTGKAGIEKARRFRPRVVLCDIGLPDGMDGYAVARAFRGDPKASRTYVVALSGYGRDEDRRRARDAGFDVHLTKPVDCAELRRLLEAASQNSGATIEAEDTSAAAVAV